VILKELESFDGQSIFRKEICKNFERKGRITKDGVSGWEDEDLFELENMRDSELAHLQIETKDDIASKSYFYYFKKISSGKQNSASIWKFILK